MDDKHIVAQARRGELSAFEELVTRYEKRVYAIALRSSGSPEDAADITQEVFLRAWRSMKDFRGDSGFATWLFRITMNQCVDYARHKQSLPPTQPLVQGEEDEERELPIPDTAPTPEEHLENSELGRELAAALDEVSDEHRRIVLLRDVSGMSYTEIAEILEVSEGTVKSRLSRARIALRKILLKRGNFFHLPSSKDMEGTALLEQCGRNPDRFRKAKAGRASGRVPIVRRAERGSGADAQHAGGGRNRAAGRTA